MLAGEELGYKVDISASYLSRNVFRGPPRHYPSWFGCVRWAILSSETVYAHEVGTVEVVDLGTSGFVNEQLLRFHVKVDCASDLVQCLQPKPQGGDKVDRLMIGVTQGRFKGTSGSTSRLELRHVVES